MSEVEPRGDACEELRKENEALRQQIIELTAACVSRPNQKWVVALICFGWTGLTVVPAALLHLLELDTDHWYGYAGYGIAFAASWTQWSIATNFAVLLAETAWKRLLLFATASIGIAVTWTVLINTSTELGSDLEELVMIAPIAAAMLAIPAIICRFMLKWQIVHASDLRPMRPTSIARYLVLMSFVAIVIAGVPKLPDEVRELSFRRDFLEIFGTPLIAGMIVSMLMMRIVLVKALFRWVPGAMKLSLGMLVACVISATSPSVHAVNEYATEVVGYIAFAVSWILSFALWYLLACVWLRCLGYRMSS